MIKSILHKTAVSNDRLYFFVGWKLSELWLFNFLDNTMKLFILTDIRDSYKYLSGTSPVHDNRVYDIFDYNKPGF